MKIYIDATTLVALGTISELELLGNLSGDLVVPPAVDAGVTTEPARTNLDRFIAETAPSRSITAERGMIDDAKQILGESERNGDVELIAAVLAHDDRVAIVSDDRRVRTTARQLGAEVTGTIGIVVRAVDTRLSPAEAKEIVRRIDRHGLHMTAELRETVYDLIETAVEE